MRLLGILAVCAIGCGGAASTEDNVLADVDTNGVTPQGQDPRDLHGKPEPPMLGLHAAKGSHGGGGGSSPLLVWKGGVILNSATVQSIFWGAKWADATFTADKMTGLDSFYAGLGGSAYAKSNIEYTGTNGQVGAAVTFQGHQVDTSAAPAHAPKTSAILAEVCKRITNPVADGYYPVYTDTPRGSAGYCAWHSYGTCNGVNVQFGFFFSLDGDSGCDPGDTTPGRSQGLAALANVSGHEYSETITDPRNGGWLDAQGQENADKCAWVFPGKTTFSNGTSWLVQGNWSNASYNAGTGYANRDGVKGCLLEGH